MIPRDKLSAMETEFEELQDRVSDSSLMSDAKKYKSLMRRYKELTEIIDAWHEYLDIEQQQKDARHLLDTENDPELCAMAKDELLSLAELMESKDALLRDLLIPNDPNDEKNAIIEIRAGTGGDEADRKSVV